MEGSTRGGAASGDRRPTGAAEEPANLVFRRVESRPQGPRDVTVFPSEGPALSEGTGEEQQLRGTTGGRQP